MISNTCRVSPTAPISTSCGPAITGTVLSRGLLENTIEQQYPLWIDPKWVTFRAQTARQSPLERPETSGRAESQWAVFAERPTDLPLSIDAFKERQAKIATPAEDETVHLATTLHDGDGIFYLSRFGAAILRSLPLCYNIARPGWHLLPQHLRYAIVRCLAGKIFVMGLEIALDSAWTGSTRYFVSGRTRWKALIPADSVRSAYC